MPAAAGIQDAFLRLMRVCLDTSRRRCDEPHFNDCYPESYPKSDDTD